MVPFTPWGGFVPTPVTAVCATPEVMCRARLVTASFPPYVQTPFTKRINVAQRVLTVGLEYMFKSKLF